MRKKTILFLSTCLFVVLHLSFSRHDLHNSLEEMLSYHVEYKAFSPTLVKRSFKLFLEQFDGYGIYFLEQEVAPYIDMSLAKAKEIAADHRKERYDAYEMLHHLMKQAIDRARKMRHELWDVLVQKGLDEEMMRIQDAGFPHTMQELQKRIYVHLLRYVRAQQQEEGLQTVSLQDALLMSQLIEQRLVRFEETVERSFYEFLAKACAKSLDAHTCFFSAREAEELRALLEKQFEGIGIVLREGIHGIVIKSVLEGGPADRSHLIHEGDRLIGVNGRKTKDASYSEVMEWLKEGKRVTLDVEDKDTRTHTVTLVRERMVLKQELLRAYTVPCERGILGVIEIPSFYESSSGPDCEKDVRRALRALQAQGELAGLVLDMRNNSGGFLSQAVKVSGVFIPCGVIAISKYAGGEMQYLREFQGTACYDGPLVVLTSKMSASATEIVAQALQDYGLALVVGDERTFGKGTIQYQTVTDDGKTAYFKVTVGRYYTVSGRSTQLEGVKADILVPSICKPFLIGEKYLPYALKNDQVSPAYLDPLVDITGPKRDWLQKNYLPYIQKRLSLWTEMKPILQKHSAIRLQQDRDYIDFLSWAKEAEEHHVRQEVFTGDKDFQLREALYIVEEMGELREISLAKKRKASYR